MVRYVQAQRLYFAACDPASRAHLVVDNSVPESPTCKTGADPTGGPS